MAGRTDGLRGWLDRVSGRAELALLAVTAIGLASGGALLLLGQSPAGDVVLAVTTGAGMGPALWWVLASLSRRRIGVDIIALLALVGALLVGEYLAGAVISLMLASGRALESRAGRRARRELSALLERAPRTARRRGPGGLETVPVEEVAIGDLVVVGPGEVIPVDGVVVGDTVVVDESALTGEPLPVSRAVDDPLRSGAVNAGSLMEMRATQTSADSTYAGIVRLVREAESSTAPFVRLADRYAVWFLLVSLGLAGAAWLFSGDLVRAVAVLVVATPCPLILAAPVAIVSGLSRCARRGVIVKGGGALELLGTCRTLVFDKTGTLTAGRPSVVEVIPAPGVAVPDLVRLAAGVEQVSAHVLAHAVVSRARAMGLDLRVPERVVEIAGQGVAGTVSGRQVKVGTAAFCGVPPEASFSRAARRRAELEGALSVYVAVDGAPAGALVLEDPVRPDAARTVRAVRRAGISRIVMLTGDRKEVAESIGAVVGVDAVFAERSPADKVEVVRLERRHGPSVMVGDGINDAPALAAADLGVAIGARGATVSSETAEVVLTVNRLDRLAEAVKIAQRSRRIALQSVLAGTGLSLVAMVVAALGYLPPVAGAVLQELIDVAVIVNALRAVRPGPLRPPLAPAEAEVARRFSAEHVLIREQIDLLRTTAESLDHLPPTLALARLRELHRGLVERVQPHERAEEETLYPMLGRALGGTDPLGAMTRAHVEILHQIRRLGLTIEQVGPDGPDAADLTELRRILYGLYAILRLHTDQEDEGYLSLADEEAAG